MDRDARTDKIIPVSMLTNGHRYFGTENNENRCFTPLWAKHNATRSTRMHAVFILHFQGIRLAIRCRLVHFIRPEGIYRIVVNSLENPVSQTRTMSFLIVVTYFKDNRNRQTAGERVITIICSIS